MDLHEAGIPEAGSGGGPAEETGVGPPTAKAEAASPRTGTARQDLLLAESRHRLRNVLALVRSIVSSTVRADMSAEAYARNLEARIEALERIQDALAGTGDAWIDLEAMISQAIAACGGEAGGRATFAGAPVSLSGHTAESLGLAVHELATNAVKYGALAVESGRIAVTWTILKTPQGDRLALEWSETGVVLASPGPRGFGSELIESAVPYDLSGTGKLTFRPSGVLCEIEIPLGDDIRARADS